MSTRNLLIGLALSFLPSTSFACTKYPPLDTEWQSEKADSLIRFTFAFRVNDNTTMKGGSAVGYETFDAIYGKAEDTSGTCAPPKIPPAPATPPKSPGEVTHIGYRVESCGYVREATYEWVMPATAEHPLPPRTDTPTLVYDCLSRCDTEGCR